MTTVTSEITATDLHVEARHSALIPGPAVEVFELCRDVTRWAEFMPAVVSARFVHERAGGDVVEITADANGTPHTWRSTRDLDTRGMTIDFTRLDPPAPLLAMRGRWACADIGGRTLVTLTHTIDVADSDAREFFTAATRSNATRDLQGLAAHFGVGASPLTGKVALVTGGTRGIGHAFAQTLADIGATVAITGTSPQTVDQGVASLKDSGIAAVDGHVVDVRDQLSIDRAFDSILADHGQIDVLVNNAGTGGGGRTHEIPYDVWDRLTSSLRSPTPPASTESWACPKRWPSRSRPRASPSTPCALASSRPTSPSNARQRYAAAWDITPDEVLARQNARFPLGRHVRPDEVARQVAYLAHPASDAITGQAMNVCGGLGLY